MLTKFDAAACVVYGCVLQSVWPVKNRQMSIKVAPNMISLEKIKDFDTFTKIA